MEDHKSNAALTAATTYIAAVVVHGARVLSMNPSNVEVGIVSEHLAHLGDASLYFLLPGHAARMRYVVEANAVDERVLA